MPAHETRSKDILVAALKKHTMAQYKAERRRKTAPEFQTRAQKPKTKTPRFAD